MTTHVTGSFAHTLVKLVLIVAIASAWIAIIQKVFS